MTCLTGISGSRLHRARDNKAQDASIPPGVEFLELTQHHHPQPSTSELGPSRLCVLAVDVTRVDTQVGTSQKQQGLVLSKHLLLICGSSLEQPDAPETVNI